MKAVIAGGGIGGLTTTICLLRAGWDVTVFERAAAISEIGAGVQISPNGVRLLEKIGVMPHLEGTLFEPEAIELRIGATGQEVFYLPLKGVAEKRWGARYIQIHRADLVSGLLTTLEHLKSDVVQTGKTVCAYENTDNGVRVLLEDGAHIEADLLVGADGVRSQIRTHMLGADAPRFTGNVAWRTIVPIEKLGVHVPPPTGCIWAGAGKHAVTTRIKGGNVANFVGIVEQDDWREEGWKIEGSKEDAMKDFGQWNPMLQKIIEEAGTIYRWALFDRPPLEKWSDGHVVLLGDAAHPMLPSLAQGAVQSIEDAYVLTQQLAQTKSVAQACEDYFKMRIERTTRVQKGAAANVRMFHRRSALSQLFTYGPMKFVSSFAPNILHRRNDWLLGKRY